MPAAHRHRRYKKRNGPVTGARRRVSFVEYNKENNVEVRYDTMGRRIPEPWQGSPSGWFEVSLSLDGKTYPRQDWFNAIQQRIHPVPFVPYNINISRDHVHLTFHVDNEKLAEALYKTEIQVKRDAPKIKVDDRTRAAMRTVMMSSLYDPTTQHLNLSKFHANEEFRRREVFAPLNKRDVLLAALQIIAKRLPNVRSLDLSDNMIYAAEQLFLFSAFAPELKSLNLGKNKVPSLRAISGLKGMQLDALVLDENPLRELRSGQTDAYEAYVREVRQIFKSLRQLDGVDLPPLLNFRVAEKTQRRLPRGNDTFLCNPDSASSIKQFLQQFFNIYDSQTSRDGLLEAYADHSQLSVTADAYSPEELEPEKPPTLLHRGKVEIVRFLNTLPKTQHDLPKLSVDLLVSTPQLIWLTVCGVYRETDQSETIKSSFKAFSRTFVLERTGASVSIVNDMLLITNATRMQISKAFRTTIASPLPVPMSPQAERAPIVPAISDAFDKLSQQLAPLTTSPTKAEAPETIVS